MTNQNKGLTHKRGLASMSKERLSEISKLGGIAAHAHGSAHEFTSAEARAAARIALHRKTVQPFSDTKNEVMEQDPSYSSLSKKR